jgi:uroporphyrinogen III methyltransferase/synthase
MSAAGRDGLSRAAGGASSRGPLAGRTVVVTRPREQAGALVGRLAELGADVLVAPAIRIVPRPLGAEARGVLERLPTYQVLVFTSVNGVQVFMDYLEEAGLGTRALAPASERRDRPVLAAIGPATAAALETHGLTCDVVPDDYVAEALLDALARRGVAPAGARVLIPRAAEARQVLPDTLRARGALVDVLPLYDTLPAAELEVPVDRLEQADFITFTSSSTVRAFVRLLETGDEGAAPRPLAERLGGVALCSIGPVTSATLREHGLTVAVEAAEYTTGGLVEAIVAAGSH